MKKQNSNEFHIVSTMGNNLQCFVLYVPISVITFSTILFTKMPFRLQGPSPNLTLPLMSSDERHFTHISTSLVSHYFVLCHLLHVFICLILYLGFSGGSDGKESACNAGDPGSIPRLGRSPGERNSLYACLHISGAEKTGQLHVKE